MIVETKCVCVCVRASERASALDKCQNSVYVVETCNFNILVK